jgi:hypothetical protein
MAQVVKEAWLVLIQQVNLPLIILVMVEEVLQLLEVKDKPVVMEVPEK